MHGHVTLCYMVVGGNLPPDASSWQMPLAPLCVPLLPNGLVIFGLVLNAISSLDLAGNGLRVASPLGNDRMQTSEISRQPEPPPFYDHHFQAICLGFRRHHRTVVATTGDGVLSYFLNAILPVT